jgi:hypothetical protein
MSKERTLALSNTIAFIATVVVNALANGLPINGKTTGELSDMYPNIFVPAGITFSIWGLIYLLLFIFIIHQNILAFRKSNNSRVILAIGPWFIVSSIANCTWIITWHYLLPVISLIVMLVLLISLIRIYLALESVKAQAEPRTQYFVFPLFGIYLGWITVATIANFTAVLVHLGWQGGAFGESTWTIVMIGIATATGIYFLIAKRDIFYTLVIIWALYGIYLKRTSATVLYEEVILAAKIGMAVCVASISYLFFNRFFNPNQ